MEKDISELRGRIVRAMNITLERLSPHDENTFGEAVSYGMGQIADAVGVHRITVFRYVFTDGELRPFHALVWDARKRSLIDDAYAVSPDLPAAVAWCDCNRRHGVFRNGFSERFKPSV